MTFPSDFRKSRLRLLVRPRSGVAALRPVLSPYLHICKYASSRQLPSIEAAVFEFKDIKKLIAVRRAEIAAAL
jgi:hypothetical protein